MIDERLKWLDKDKEQRVQQLHLMIHNCNVYRVKESTRKISMKKSDAVCQVK